MVSFKGNQTEKKSNTNLEGGGEVNENIEIGALKKVGHILRGPSVS